MKKQSPATANNKNGGSRGGKTAACCSTKAGMKRGPWTPEEDELLSSYIKREGEGQWRILPKRAGLLRCGKSCRLRWMNYLRPSVKRGHFAEDEEDLILRLHRLLGNRWSLIAGRIPGRTDNEIKNYWNTHLSKKLIRQGIDPKTHKPFSESSPSSLSKPNIENAASLPRPPPRGKKRNITSLPSSSKRLSILCGEKSSSPSTNTSVLPPFPHEKPVLPDTYNEIFISTIKKNETENKGKSEFTSHEDDACHEEDESTKKYHDNNVLSSFMNLLMDEEPHAIMPSGDFSNDLLISNPSQTFTLFGGVGWDAPIMNSPDQLAWRNLHDSKNFNEDVEKHF